MTKYMLLMLLSSSAIASDDVHIYLNTKTKVPFMISSSRWEKINQGIIVKVCDNNQVSWKMPTDKQIIFKEFDKDNNPIKCEDK